MLSLQTSPQQTSKSFSPKPEDTASRRNIAHYFIKSCNLKYISNSQKIHAGRGKRNISHPQHKYTFIRCIYLALVLQKPIRKVRKLTIIIVYFGLGTSTTYWASQSQLIYLPYVHVDIITVINYKLIYIQFLILRIYIIKINAIY